EGPRPRCGPCTDLEERQVLEIQVEVRGEVLSRTAFGVDPREPTRHPDAPVALGSDQEQFIDCDSVTAQLDAGGRREVPGLGAGPGEEFPEIELEPCAIGPEPAGQAIA